MTETTETTPQSGPGGYVQIWADSISQVIGQTTGSPAPCTAMTEPPAGTPAPAESDVWIVSTSSGSLRGEMSLRLPQASALRLAQSFMSEPIAPAAPFSAEHREAILELLRQVAGLAAGSMKGIWGEVQMRLDAAPGPPSWSASSASWLRVGQADPDALLLELGLSAALAAELRAGKTEAAKAPSPEAASLSPDNPEGKLELLMDVELSVTLSFGGRRLLLREVLDLSPGSVIELDRRVEAPVDLLLDGRLVARGEVVVIEGNYGMRVTEVLSAAIT